MPQQLRLFATVCYPIATISKCLVHDLSGLIVCSVDEVPVGAERDHGRGVAKPAADREDIHAGRDQDRRVFAPRPAHVSPDGPRYFGGTFLLFKALRPPRTIFRRPTTAIVLSLATAARSIVPTSTDQNRRLPVVSRRKVSSFVVATKMHRLGRSILVRPLSTVLQMNSLTLVTSDLDSPSSSATS